MVSRCVGRRGNFPVELPLLRSQEARTDYRWAFDSKGNRWRAWASRQPPTGQLRNIDAHFDIEGWVRSDRGGTDHTDEAGPTDSDRIACKRRAITGPGSDA